MVYPRNGRCIVHLLAMAFISSKGTGSILNDEEAAKQWLVPYEQEATKIYTKSAENSWNYNTNITDHNAQVQLNYSTQVVKPYFSKVAENASLFVWRNFPNATLKKIFKGLADTGSAALSDEKYNEIQVLLKDLETIYSTAKVCKNGKNPMSLDPELSNVMTSSHNYDELLWVWKSWRDATGPKMRRKYQQFVELSNEAARLNGYADTGDSWRDGYNIPDYDFRANLETLYIELKPLYVQLHTYVRRKLKETYGAEKFPSSGHIPAHLLGNMWAQTWGNVESLVKPFTDSTPVNATPALQLKSIKDIFQMSDEFFVSLGLKNLSTEFWERSMLSKPTDGREVVCHASAWDFYNGTDVRIKQCTKKTMEDFITVHHEMGHIQYYLQYKDQFLNFRRGANPGFHEAVGDVLALSVATPAHLKEVGLIETLPPPSNETDVNFLLGMALEKIAFLPFGKLMDDYRWRIFNGSITPDKYNVEWWKLRCKYQGVSPPVERNETDFDAGAKYHIPGNTPYVRYFVSFVLQFQFHKALCAATNHTGSLHTCDIYRSVEAGTKLGNMLKLGSSVDWPEALYQVTGTRSMTAGPLIEYFMPLIDWLREENDKHGELDTEWNEECPSEIPRVTIASGKCGTTPTTSTPTPNIAVHLTWTISIWAYFLLSLVV